MLYLTLFLTGFLIDRYLLPVMDLLYELFNHKLSGIAQSESIKARRAELLFQREMGVEDNAEPRVGFTYPESLECEVDEDDER